MIEYKYYWYNYNCDTLPPALEFELDKYKICKKYGNNLN